MGRADATTCDACRVGEASYQPELRSWAGGTSVGAEQLHSGSSDLRLQSVLHPSRPPLLSLACWVLRLPSLWFLQLERLASVSRPPQRQRQGGMHINLHLTKC